MKGRDGYAVFFFPQAIEALGDAIKPYMQDSPAGPHVPCDEIDTGGALIEMTIKGRMPTGEDVTLELMVPTSMVRMIVSRESGGMFGFGPRSYQAAAPIVALSAETDSTRDKSTADAPAGDTSTDAPPTDDTPTDDTPTKPAP